MNAFGVHYVLTVIQDRYPVTLTKLWETRNEFGLCQCSKCLLTHHTHSRASQWLVQVPYDLTGHLGQWDTTGYFFYGYKGCSE